MFVHLIWILLKSLTVEGVRPTNSSLPVQLDKLVSGCQLYSTEQRFTGQNIIFSTPTSIVLQDQPRGTEGAVQRWIASRTEDGGCREESSMKLMCKNTGEVCQDPCAEFLRRDTSEPKHSLESCFAQNLQQSCTQMELAGFLRSELVAGLLLRNRDGNVRLSVETEHPATPLNVLVVGASCGAVPTFITRNFPKSHVTAIDIDPAAIFAATHFFDSTASNIDYVHGDALEELPRQPDKSFDFVVIDAYDPSDQAPVGLYDIESLSLVKSKLKTGGRVVLTLIARNHAQVRTDLESMGFETRSVLTPQSYPVVGGSLPGASPIVLDAKFLHEVEQWVSNISIEG